MTKIILLLIVFLSSASSLFSAPAGIGADMPDQAKKQELVQRKGDREIRALEFYIAGLMEKDPGKKIMLLLDAVKLDPHKRLPLQVLIRTLDKAPAAVPTVKKTVDQLRRVYPANVFLALQSAGIDRRAGGTPESITQKIRPVLKQKPDKKTARDFYSLALTYTHMRLQTPAPTEILPYPTEDTRLKETALFYYTTAARRDMLLQRKSPAEELRKKYLAELSGAELPSDADLRRHLALLNTIKEFDAAFAAAGKAVQKRKTLLTTLFYLEAAARSGKLEVLNRELKKHAALPVSVCAQLRFQCYQAQGNFVRAREELANLSGKNQKQDKLLQISRQMRDISGMKKVLKAMESAPRKNQAALAIGYLNLAETSGEVSALEKAMELLGTSYLQNPVLANAVGYVSAVVGKDLSTAEMLLEYALSKDGRNAAYLDSMAWIKYKQKDYKQALEYIRKAICYLDSNTGSSTIADHAGDIYQALGSKKTAQKYYKMALEAYEKDKIGNADFDPAAVRKKVTTK